MQRYTLVATLLAASTPPPMVVSRTQLSDTARHTPVYSRPCSCSSEVQLSVKFNHLSLSTNFSTHTLSSLQPCLSFKTTAPPPSSSLNRMVCPHLPLSHATLLPPLRDCVMRDTKCIRQTERSDMTFLCTIAKVGPLILSVAPSQAVYGSCGGNVSA